MEVVAFVVAVMILKDIDGANILTKEDWITLWLRRFGHLARICLRFALAVELRHRVQAVVTLLLLVLLCAHLEQLLLTLDEVLLVPRHHHISALLRVAVVILRRELHTKPTHLKDRAEAKANGGLLAAERSTLFIYYYSNDIR